MTRDILVRGVAPSFCRFWLCGTAASGDEFPFDQEFLLDAASDAARKAYANPAR